MADEAQEVVVLTDSKGNFYVLSRQTVEAGLVADEHKAEVQAMISGEVSGYSAYRSDFLVTHGIIIVGGLTAFRAGTGDLKLSPAFIRMSPDAGQLKI